MCELGTDKPTVRGLYNELLPLARKYFPVINDDLAKTLIWDAWTRAADEMIHPEHRIESLGERRRI